MIAPARVKSADRVFEILEFFGQAQRPLRLKEIVSHFGYPPSSTTALLKTMSDRGYLSFNRNTKTYLPTSRLTQLGSWISFANFEGSAVLQTMKNLQESTQELIVLGTPNHIYVEYVEALRSTQAFQLWSPAGTKRLIVQLGMGWLFLSRMPKAVVSRIYKETVASNELKCDEFPLEALLSRLDKVLDVDVMFTRQTDYVRTIAHPGGAMVSTLVPTPPDHRPLAIGVGGPAERIAANLDHIVTRMKAETSRLAEVVTSGRF